MTTDDRIRLHWYLPNSGETRQFRQGGTNVVPPDQDSAGPGGFRTLTLSYVTEIAPAMEEAGCTSVLVPTGSSCEDLWIVSPVLLAHTRTLLFLAAPHPPYPAPAADRASRGDLPAARRTQPPGVERGDR